MKKLAVFVVLLIAASLLAFSYRTYKAKTEMELAARRALIEEREIEAQRRAEATKEAQRLAALQLEQAAVEAERRLAEMRKEEALAQKQRAAAEAEMARLDDEFEELRRLKEAAILAAQTSAEERKAELAQIAAAEHEAMKKLRALESEQVKRTDREAAHAAALEKQIKLEAEAQERAARFRASQPR
jgi:hypothetical protein